MKTKNKIGALVLGLWMTAMLPSNVQAQVSEGGTPHSFTLSSSRARLSIPNYTTGAIPLQSLQAEDVVLDHQDYPYRFGYGFDVSLDIKNEALLQELADGSKLWVMKVTCPDALSVNFLYSKFKLPAGAKFFIYNEDRSQVLGAYTKNNNQASGKFGTEIVAGSTVTLEYSEPANPEFPGELVIGKIVHGYRAGLAAIKPLAAGACEVNINCPEAAGWENEKRSVARLLINGQAFCTGTLLNNARQDDKPYFLTANHCLLGQDAINSPDASGWIFYWNYESATCSGTTGPENQTTTGAVIRANNDASDFALLELLNQPPSTYKVFYSGWNRSTTAANGVVGIHHPDADIKKFSKDNSTIVDNEPGFWKVPSWDIGVTEGGSSGSAIFDFNKRVVGQLLGGSSECGGSDLSDSYGKLYYSWDKGGTVPQRRLKDWLDPDNTNVVTVDGKNPGVSGNISPVATITSPTNNATFNAPATITIAATATDQDGTVRRVEFFNGTTSLGIDSIAPYSVTWSNVAAGTYNLTAVATDNKGAKGTSSPISVRVNLANAPATFFQNCDFDPNGYSVGLAVGNYTTTQMQAAGIQNDDLSSIRVQSGYEVVVYTENNFTGTSKTYSADVSCLVADNLNDEVSSIIVRKASGNTPPTVSITSPANNSSFTAPASITIAATATDADGTISNVQFYNGSILLGSDNTAPYSFTWNGVAAGTYQITAKATDNGGLTTTSSVITVKVVTNNDQIAKVYKHCNFSNLGYAVNLGVGNYTLAQLQAKGILNDDISSVKIKSGYEIVLYVNNNFTGQSITLRSDNSCLVSSNFNDVTSSLRVRAIPPNQPPSITITSPTSNASFTAPATFGITVKATDTDGAVMLVEFYNGTALLGSDNYAPFSYIWTGVTAGNYTITAKATDEVGGSTTSAAINISISGAADACSSILPFVENGNYLAGSQVQNVGTIYECKPFPYSSWCNGAAWAYAPGTGSAWTDAWTQVGSCSKSAKANLSGNSNQITVSPNPAAEYVLVDFASLGQNSLYIQLYDAYGHEVMQKEITSGDQLNVSSLPAGVYTMRSLVGQEVIINRIVIK